MSDQAENLNSSQGSNPLPSAFGTMLRRVLDRAKAVLIAPAATWAVIKGETTSIKDIYQNYLAILAAIPALASFIGLTVIGISIPFFGTWRYPFFPALVSHLIQYALSLAMIYVAALVLEKLAPKFEAKTDLLSTFKLVAYSVTPAWLAGVFGIFPGSLTMLAGLLGAGYSIYVFMLGVQPMTGVPESRKIGYVAVSALTIIGLAIIIHWVSNNFAPYPGPSGFNGQPIAPDSMKRLEDSMKILEKAVAPLNH